MLNFSCKVIRIEKIEVIFCVNDMMALGAIQYLDKLNQNNALVARFDSRKEG